MLTLFRANFLADQAGTDWAEARKALPSHLQPLSPLYTIYTRGDSALTAEMAIPNGAEPLVLMDLYRWDQAAQHWVFLPSQQDASRGVVAFQPADSPTTVMAVHVSPEATSIGLVVSEGAPALDLSAYHFAMPEGLSIDAQGHMTGSPVQATALVSMPVVVNRLGGFTDYAVAGQQEVIINQLVSAMLPYQGLVLDFEPADGYADFLVALATQVHAHGKELHIVVRGTSVDGYNLPELAEFVDRMWLAPGDDPNAYLPGGSARMSIESAISQVDRAKLGLWVSGLNVDVSGSEIRSISLDEALALFGSVQVAGEFDSTIPIDPGASLPFRLTGSVDSMGFDIPLGMNYLTYHDGAGQTHYVYFSSAQNLARKVAWARYYGLGAIVVHGVAHSYAPGGLAQALQALPASSRSAVLKR
jgi:hypothetical protein